VLALLLAVLVSMAPGAMMLSAASTSGPTAAHQHRAPSTPHHHDLPGDCCCGLCSANCIACGGIAHRTTPARSGARSARDLGHAGRSRHVVDTSSWHLLPPPIGPPS
jgi:hypothetical protein